jgi:hypothetical protein
MGLFGISETEGSKDEGIGHLTCEVLANDISSFWPLGVRRTKGWDA